MELNWAGVLHYRCRTHSLDPNEIYLVANAFGCCHTCNSVAVLCGVSQSLSDDLSVSIHAVFFFVFYIYTYKYLCSLILLLLLEKCSSTSTCTGYHNHNLLFISRRCLFFFFLHIAEGITDFKMYYFSNLRMIWRGARWVARGNNLKPTRGQCMFS